MKPREVITTSLEIIGAVCVVAGICSFSVPIGVIVAGVLMIIGGGLAARVYGNGLSSVLCLQALTRTR